MYKEKDKRQEGLFYPSLEVERKTKAMNKYISGVVSLLALFPVCIFVLVMYHAFMSYFLELVSSFIMDYFVFVVLIPVLICLVLSYKIVLMMHAFLVSYKCQGNQIIKGVIIAPVKKQKIDRVISDTITVANAINMMGGDGNYQNRRTVRRAFRFFRMMRDNMNPEIVQAYFDTDLYNKKVYNNPQLIKNHKIYFGISL